jgi:dynein heavy chain
VAKNLVDCFCGLKTIHFIDDANGNPTKESYKMESQDGETVGFEKVKNYMCVGEVEDWLRTLEGHMQAVLKAEVNVYLDEMGKDQDFHFEKWIDEKTSQLAIVMDQVNWTTDVSRAFDELEEGNEDSMRICLRLQKQKLDNMIMKVVDGPMGISDKEWKALKTKTIAIITIQVHCRDVLETLVKNNIKEVSSFTWQSQLRFSVSEEEETEGRRTVNALVADWMQEYKYE